MGNNNNFGIGKSGDGNISGSSVTHTHTYTDIYINTHGEAQGHFNFIYLVVEVLLWWYSTFFLSHLVNLLSIAGDDGWAKFDPFDLPWKFEIQLKLIRVAERRDQKQGHLFLLLSLVYSFSLV